MNEVLAHKPNTQPPVSIDSSLKEQIKENDYESYDENLDVATGDNDGGQMVEDHGDEETKEPDSIMSVLQEETGKPNNELEVQNKDLKKTSDEKDTKNNPTRLLPTKRKKLSNCEKGVSLICSTLNETSKKEMERSLEAENARCQQEMDFQLKLMEMENQRRVQERKHEIRLFSLFMGSNMQARNTPQPSAQFGHHVPEHFGSFPQYFPNITSPHQYAMNMSVSSESASDTSSSLGTAEGAHSTYFSL